MKYPEEGVVDTGFEVEVVPVANAIQVDPDK